MRWAVHVARMGVILKFI